MLILFYFNVKRCYELSRKGFLFAKHTLIFYLQIIILLQYSNMINTISCTVVNLLLTVLLNKTRFIASKTRFLAFSIDFWTQNLGYL